MPRQFAGALLLSWLVFAGPGVAQDKDTVAAIEAAWSDWLSENDSPDSAIAIGWEGTAVHTSGSGVDPASPVDLASNSKAITAACLASFVEDETLDYETTLGDIEGLKVPDNARSVTLASLLSQTSGLAPDETQSAMTGWLNETTPRHDDAMAAALAKPRSAAGYAYNNENYAILGAVIDVLSDKDHEATCDGRVLRPAGVTTGTLSPRFGAFAAWGGWRMSVEDYLVFHAATFGPDAEIGAAPTDFPHAEIGQGLLYGMGMLLRPNARNTVFFHTGLLCFPGTASTVHYVASYENGWSVSVWADACPDNEALAALDADLWEAAHP
jgi:CubicO group peptidase (beta-lactamase class C family)